MNENLIFEKVRALVTENSPVQSWQPYFLSINACTCLAEWMTPMLKGRASHQNCRDGRVSNLRSPFCRTERNPLCGH